MRKPFLVASIAAIALIPSLAAAQSTSQSSCEQQRSTRVVATVAGAGVGGVLGNVVAGRGDKTLGTVIGAVGGAVIANQVAKPSRDCSRAFGYYDSDNRWHATGVSEANARGYYDRDGSWNDGAPDGHYADGNRWVANTGPVRGEGAYSAQGGWIPASVNGYYDRNDQWVAGSGQGSYDASGRWIRASDSQPTQSERRTDAYGYYDAQGMWHASVVTQGRPTGYYDRNNAWVAGTPNGHYDARRNWVPHRDDGTASGSYDAQNRWIPASSPGYYDSNGQWVAGTASGYYNNRGRWVAGVTTGHYDARGRWISGSASGHTDTNGVWIADPQPGYYDSRGRWQAGATTGYYDSRGRWVSTAIQPGGNNGTEPVRTITSQLDWLDTYVRNANAQRTLSRRETSDAQRELRSIRTRERGMRHDRSGDLSIRNEAELQVRIDRLSDRLRIAPQ
jgi:hypothetical protein